MRILVSIFGIVQHTRLVPRLPLIDPLLATPSSHRVHHGRDAKYLDKNYGEVLMLWDHLFGTNQREEEEPHCGVTEPINTLQPGEDRAGRPRVAVASLVRRAHAP